MVARKKYIYLCTNAILLERKQQDYTPSKYLTFSVHMDGLQEEHDHAVCRDGVYDVAVKAMQAALKRGFRVTTNTTLFDDADPARVRAFFDAMMDLGVEGMMISPGYSYQKAPNQKNFLKRSRTHQLFSRILENRKRHWRFNQSPLFLDFLMGKREYQSRRGAIRLIIFSAGRSRVICCRKAMFPRFSSCWIRRVGMTMAPEETKNAPTVWCTAVMSLRLYPTRSDRCPASAGPFS